MIIPNIRHPLYDHRADEWEKWRLTYSGGTEFTNEYLVKFSDRETTADFNSRKIITPTPNFAKAAVNDVRNSIFQRLSEVNRRAGSETYMSAAAGHDLGVDRKGSSMNHFIGRQLLSELMVMAKVGVFVDMPAKQGPTIKSNLGMQPYLYRYLTEDILSWTERTDVPDEFEAVLLRDYVQTYHETGLTSKAETIYRLLTRQADGVHVEFYKTTVPMHNGLAMGEPESIRVNQFGIEEDIEYVLELDSIPFVVLELSDSLIADIANHQIALLNLESSDINYSLKSNFPFYVEQQDDRDYSHFAKSGDDDDDGEALDAGNSKSKEITVGATQGRSYAPNLDRPEFINPSSEPLEASMKKQTALKHDIRTLINLSLSNVQGKQASAESKELDERGLESGLSSIGLELEHAERKIARFWHTLEKSKSDFSIKYPEKWSLKSDADRREDAKAMRDLRDTIPSEEFQKHVSKEISRILLGGKIPESELEEIAKEIEGAEAYSADPETVFRAVELAILDLKTAASILGISEDSVDKAAADHQSRLERILTSQTKAQAPDGNPGARGITDLDPNPGQSARDEKTASRDNTQKAELDSNIRGNAKEEANL